MLDGAAHITNGSKPKAIHPVLVAIGGEPPKETGVWPVIWLGSESET